jgi:hypothetical protein
VAFRFGFRGATCAGHYRKWVQTGTLPHKALSPPSVRKVIDSHRIGCLIAPPLERRRQTILVTVPVLFTGPAWRGCPLSLGVPSSMQSWGLHLQPYQSTKTSHVCNNLSFAPLMKSRVGRYKHTVCTHSAVPSR